MISLEDIKRPVAKGIEDFNRAFEKSLGSDNPVLLKLNEYLLRGKGKQLRPILVLLAARICSDIESITIDGAIAVELLHTASIVHDDVVDFTLERRGRESINAIWGNKIAVLAGDYIVSSALRHAAKTKKIEIIDLLSTIGMGLSAGEILHLFHVNRSNVSEESYFEIIRKKTAILFSLGMEIGAISVNADTQKRKALHCFGENLGICFQLKDDIFDYFDDVEIGKPTGNDIKEGKVTLPLIYALRSTKGEERDEMARRIDKEDFSPESVKEIIDFARKNGGIDYAEEQMELYKLRAVEALSVFPDSEEKTSLMACLEYTSRRTK